MLRPIWKHCGRHNLDYPKRDGCHLCNLETLNKFRDVIKKIGQDKRKFKIICLKCGKADSTSVDYTTDDDGVHFECDCGNKEIR